MYSGMIGVGTCTHDRSAKIHIYVYQIDDQTYGAGLLEIVCKRRGKIVERWPIDDEKQIAFVKRHGSAFNGVGNRVKELAEKAIFLQEDVLEYDEEREALLIELCELPLGKRIKSGLRVIFGRYQEN